MYARWISWSTPTSGASSIPSRLARQIRGTPHRRPAHRPPHPQMAGGGYPRGWDRDGQRDRDGSSPPRVELANPGFRFGTSRQILTRQQNRRSLLACAEQHQSREINQLRQNQCTPRSPSMLVSGQSAEIALPGRHRELARRPQEEHSPLSVFGTGRWQA
jgi:hypothetical protein